MKFRYAIKLHNGDEVTLKKTGEICKVQIAWVNADGKQPLILMDLISPHKGWMHGVDHRAIR